MPTSAQPIPVRFGLVGLGGYAGPICDTLRESPHANLVCVYEPNYSAHSKRAGELRTAGVKLCDSYAALLREPIEAVWLPIPIHLHRTFTEEAVAAKIATLCEKPAAGTVQDIDAMIAARDRAGVQVAIGFQNLCDPQVLTLKRRLVSGEFGEIRSISLAGCWPRSSGYYGRNTWAGKMRIGDTWILDSPLANAMNHYAQLALYLGGQTVHDSAVGHHVQAELYRVNGIENFDTCSIRVMIDRDVPLLILMTHACAGHVTPSIRIRCANGEVRLIPEDRIDWDINGTKGSALLGKQVRLQLAGAFHDFLRKRPDAPSTIATLENARAPLALVNAVSMAASVATIDSEFVQCKRVIDGELRFIPGIEAIFQSCELTGRMLHESGAVSWSTAPGEHEMHEPNHFTSPKSPA